MNQASSQPAATSPLGIRQPPVTVPLRGDAAASAERARTFSLASMLAEYPSEEWSEVVGELGGHPGAAPLRAALAREPLDGLRGRYLRLFEANKHRVPLYETEYGRMRGLSKGHDLADVAGFYQAFGFDLARDEGGRELHDHLSVELEFYALMHLKGALLAEREDEEGQEIVDLARAAFLEHHLGRFALAVSQQAPVAADPVLGPVFAWIGALVQDECRRVGVTPAPLDFFAAEAEDEELKCGATECIPNLPTGGPR